jgi:hypothetical protein
LGTGEAVEYIARVLGSHGYVVAAPDFPRTNRSQGEQAHARDVFNQPRDVVLLVSMEGASHLAFADEGKWFRWFEQPDEVGCAFAGKTIDRNKRSDEPWYDELGGIEEGYVQEIDPNVCEYEVSSAINPLRQQQLTVMAVHSFLECQFAETPDDRERWCGYLRESLDRENQEISLLRRNW